MGSSGDKALTNTRALMGSPLYMSPEQMQEPSSVDTRADIWALGAILYELVSGKVPFPGQTLPEVCLKITTGDPTPMTAVKAGIPAALEAVIRRCLTRDRKRRYQTIADLAAALGPFASAPRRSVMQADGPPPDLVATQRGSIPRLARRKLVVPTLIATGAAMAIAVSWVATARTPAGAGPPAPSEVTETMSPAPAAATPAAEPPAPQPRPAPPTAPAERAPAAVEPPRQRVGARRTHKPGPPPARTQAANIPAPSRATKPPAPKAAPAPDRSPLPALPRGLIDERR
jgi:serine/threonine-protein kinase